MCVPSVSRFIAVTRRATFLAAFAVAASVASIASSAQAPVKRPPAKKAATPAKPAKSADSVVVPPAAAADTVRAPMGTITGIVYDSVHSSPLGDATVTLEGTDKGTITNRLGIFQIDSITPGTYKVRVQHVLLDSLGIQMTTQPFELADKEEKTFSLGIPSAATLVAISCPAARRALGPSAVIGRLLDADSDRPVEGARVSVAWLEMSLNAGLRKIPRLRDALTGPDGVYRICGLPAEFEGTLQASLKGISTAEVRLTFAGDPLIVQGLKIGNSETVAAVAGDSAAKLRAKETAGAGPSFSAPTLRRGNASLAGKVISANGQPVVGARVDVVGTPGATLTREGGVFRIDSLPSGTQSVVVRQIGYAPVETPVELSTRGPAEVTVTMSKPATVLNTVVVKADREVGLERVGFTQRQKSGMGHYIDSDDIMKRAPNMLTDVFRTVPGLRVSPSGNGMDYVVQSSRNVTGGCVKYYVDGAVWESVFPGDVDRLVPPTEIAAIEVYNGASTPAQFQAAGSSSCASIVIWTKTRVDAPRGKR
jgi:hypothetical protein